jgi:ribosomal protein L11 methylase PrmA
MPLEFYLIVMNILADVLVAFIVKLIDELTIKN